jgi:hypothetical protein
MCVLDATGTSTASGVHYAVDRWDARLSNSPNSQGNPSQFALRGTMASHPRLLYGQHLEIAVGSIGHSRSLG